MGSADLVGNDGEIMLSGMYDGKACHVKVTKFCSKSGGADWQMMVAKGPLTDWSAWENWGGDRRFLWQRAYPFTDWGLAEFLGKRSNPGTRWMFESPPIVVDTLAEKRTIEAIAAQRESALSSSSNDPAMEFRCAVQLLEQAPKLMECMNWATKVLEKEMIIRKPWREQIHA